MNTQKFNVTKPSLVDVFSNVANLHELFLANKKAGLLSFVDVRIKEVALVDFFQALQFFKTQTNCPLHEIRDQKTQELIAYCFHYVPCIADSFSVCVVSEFVSELKAKPSLMNMQ